MKIISYIARKIKTFTINLLEILAFSSTYAWFTFCLYIVVYLGVLGNGPIIKSLGSIIILTYAIGWAYQIYKQNIRIEELESLLNTKQTFDSEKAKHVKEDLADLMHDIWAEDIANLSNPSSEELVRGGTSYLNLSEEDKRVNRIKAEQVFNIFSYYYNLEETKFD